MALAPTVTTGAPTAITGTGATLNGTVNSQGQSATTYEFAYDYTRDSFCTSNGAGSPAGYVTVAPSSPNGDQQVSATITGFSPGDSICYALIANPSTTPIVGNLVSFTTTSLSAGLSAGSASSLPNEGATFSGTVNPQGESGLSYAFYVGTPSGATCSGGGSLVGTQPLGYSDSSEHVVTGTFPGTYTGQTFGGFTLVPGTTYCFYLQLYNSGFTLVGTSNVATFTTSPPVHLTVSITGGTNYGGVRSSTQYDYGETPYLIDCGFGNADCQGTYVQGTVPVTLIAAAANGEGVLGHFDGWTGACSGTSPTCTLVMSADHTVGAAFSCVKGCGSSGPGGPSSATVGKAVSSALGVAAKIGAILKAGGYLTSVTAPAPGTLTITWSTGSGTHATRKVIVASGSKTFAKAGKAKLKIKLTGAGRTLLKRSKHLKLTVTGVFKVKSGTKVTKTRTIKLHR